MTIDELRQYNGQNGKSAYVAVNGKIFDVTSSHLWKEGNHEGVHHAGNDLTEDLKRAPHIRSLIEKFPVVDSLTEKTNNSSNKTGLIIGFVVVGIVLTIFIFK